MVVGYLQYPVWCYMIMVSSGNGANSICVGIPGHEQHSNRENYFRKVCTLKEV